MTCLRLFIIFIISSFAYSATWEVNCSSGINVKRFTGSGINSGLTPMELKTCADLGDSSVVVKRMEAGEDDQTQSISFGSLYCPARSSFTQNGCTVNSLPGTIMRGSSYTKSGLCPNGVTACSVKCDMASGNWADATGGDNFAECSVTTTSITTTTISCLPNGSIASDILCSGGESGFKYEVSSLCCSGWERTSCPGVGATIDVTSFCSNPAVTTTNPPTTTTTTTTTTTAFVDPFCPGGGFPSRSACESGGYTCTEICSDCIQTTPMLAICASGCGPWFCRGTLPTTTTTTTVPPLRWTAGPTQNHPSCTGPGVCSCGSITEAAYPDGSPDGCLNLGGTVCTTKNQVINCDFCGTGHYDFFRKKLTCK